MGNFFTNIGGMLKGGWNVLGNTWNTVKESVTYAGEFWQDKFFPQNQKTTIKPSLVSNQPYTTYSGVRTTSQEAPTITPWYQNWWNSAKTKFVDFTSGVGNWFAGMNVRKEKLKTVNVLATEGNSLIRGAATTVSAVAKNVLTALPDYFNQKWGLTSRGNTGDKIGNSPYVPTTTVVHLNETQSNQAATEKGLFESFLGLLGMGSQPKGEYNIAYPQEAAAPAMIFPVSAPQDSSGQMNMGSLFSAPNLIMFALLAGGLYFVIKKGGKK